MFENPDKLICFGAGNDGRQNNGSTLCGISASKNVLTVGATLNARPIEMNEYYNEGSPVGNPDNVIRLSNRGPTIEDRIKPDVVAPDAAILAARSGQLDAIHAKDYDNFPDRFYAFGTGTSMACPLVAGCAAVLREALVKRKKQVPSGALLKALLVNGSMSIERGHVAILGPARADGTFEPYQQRVIGPAPNSIQGHRRVSLVSSLESVSNGYYLDGWKPPTV